MWQKLRIDLIKIGKNEILREFCKVFVLSIWHKIPFARFKFSIVVCTSADTREVGDSRIAAVREIEWRWNVRDIFRKLLPNSSYALQNW